MITILAPTACGKTQLAVHLAKRLDAEIISADSRQVYRGMDIGTGKDLEEYIVNGVPVPYHLIDIHEPGYEYNVFEFQKDFLKHYQEITIKGKEVILCGGTGLYIESVVKQYQMQEVPRDENLRKNLADKTDSELITVLESYTSLHNQTDTCCRERLIRAIEIQKYQNEQAGKVIFPKIKNLIIGIDFERSVVRERITLRLKQRLENGLIEEVKNLLGKGISSERLIRYGLEYKYVTMHILGELTYEEMFESLNIAIHQFAKRQMTWFRRMQRNGIGINWIDGNLPLNEKVETILLQYKNIE